MIGARVKELRKLRKLTQEALVARFPPEAGISIGYFRQLEGGKQRRWNIETLEVVATALEVPIGALLPDYENNPAWREPSNAPAEERLLEALRVRDWRAVLVALGELAAAVEPTEDPSPEELLEKALRGLKKTKEGGG